MFVVKRLGKNGMWSAVSLIDENGSFRGEAKFETREEAEDYMAIYLERMKNRPSISPEGIKVFDESKSEKENLSPKEEEKSRPGPASKPKKALKTKKVRKKS